MSPKQLGILFSTLLILLGSTVLWGWVFKISVLTQILPGMIAMVPNSAVSFILLGTGFLLLSLPTPRRLLIQKILFISIIILSSLSLSQDIFNYDLGIDSWSQIAWLQDPNPTPGRMAPNTCLGFIFSGIAGLLLPYPHRRNGAEILITLITLIFLLALLGLIVYSLKLEFIFSSYKYTRMAIHTSAGFFLASFALWCLLSQTSFYIAFYKEKEDKKIVIISGILLLFISLIAGMGSIASLTYINLMSFHQKLESILFVKINSINQNVQSLSQQISFISQNPLLAESILREDTSALQMVTDYLNQNGFSLVKFTDKSKFYSESNQELKKSNATLMHLNLPFKNNLFWKNGLWLQFEIPIKYQQKILGFFSGNYFLSPATATYLNYQNLGNTGEVVICQRIDNNFASCFPTRLTPKNFSITLSDNHKPKPMGYALNDLSGVINAIDYRHHNVAAAFAPISNLGIGMVIKMESVEIYSPLRNKLLIILPTVFLLIGCGLILLRWQVSPLVKKVVSAKKESLFANQELSQRNTEIHFLRDLSSAIQASSTLEQSLIYISRYGENILFDVNVTLFLMDTTANGFKAATQWGKDTLGKNIFQTEDCCAALMKRPHHVGTVHHKACEHFGGSTMKKYTSCIPLIAHNEVIGVLSIDWDDKNKQDISAQLDLAVAMVEQLALGISNIQLRDKLTQQSIRDPLTDLYNLRYLEETLEREIDRAKRGRLPLSVLILDIDKFKMYNDTYGHNVGDFVLKQFAKLLQKFTRLGDIACRYGGEEFVIILINTSSEIAFKRAEQIKNEISHLPLQYQQNNLNKITVSIGIATYPLDGLDLVELMNAADKALYQAKNTGRNKVITATHL